MSPSPVRILVVDRDEDLEDTCRALGTGGPFELHRAATIDQLPDLTRPGPAFEVALVGEHLRERRGAPAKPCGLALLRRLCAAAHAPAAIFLCSGDSEAGVEALQAGAFHYFAKPLARPAELSLYIAKAAELHRLRSTRDLITGDQLQAIQLTNLAITTTTDPAALLDTILDNAVSLLRARTGGLYRYYPERGELTLVACSREETIRGKTLRVGEGMAGQLALGRKPFLIVPDYRTWPDRAEVYAGYDHFGAVLGIPVKWQGKVLGVLYVNDTPERRLTVGDARVLQILGRQAAIVLASTDLRSEGERKLQRLRNLSQATQEILDDLAGMSLGARLRRIAKNATTILNAETCGVFLVEKKGFLTLRASYGHREGGFIDGLERPIRGGEKSGLTGWIAHRGTLFNAHGEQLKNHSAVRGEKNLHTPSPGCYSLLAIPLKRRSRPGSPSSQDDVIGLLRVDNKKGDDGAARPNVRFNKEDEWVLRIFAEEVAVALETAKLVRELEDEKEYKSRLIDSSPLGIIAIDRDGAVTAFNAQAERILGYTPEQVLDGPVDRLYFDPQTPRRIGAELHKRKGMLADYDSAVKHRDGHAIPIRISATWLLDAEGNRIGSAGYFQDLRQKQERQKLLVRATNVVAAAEDLTQGLQSLAEMVMSLLHHSFCRILLLDEEETSWVVEAAALAPHLAGEIQWEPLAAQPLRKPVLEQLSLQSGPVVVRRKDRRSRTLLDRLAADLRLSSSIASLLLVPATVHDRLVALLEVGEVGKEQFQPEEQELAAAIAAHTVLLIDKFRSHRTASRQGRRLEALQSAIEELARASETPGILQAIARSAVSFLGADGALVCSYDDEQDVFLKDALAGAGFAEESMPIFCELEGRQGASGPAALKRGRITWPDLAAQPALHSATRDLLQREGFASLQAVALRTGTEAVGVLYLAHREPGSLEDSHSLTERFLPHAAFSLWRARLLEQAFRAHQLADATAEMMVLGKGDFEETLTSVLQDSRKGLGCDAASLFIFEHGRLVQLPRSSQPDRNGRFSIAGDVEAARFIRRIALHKTHMAVDNVATLPRRSFLLAQGVQSFIAVPLRFSGQRIGVLFLSYATRHHFTAAEIRSIRLFSNQVAITLHNAQLYQQATRREKTLNALYEAGQAISKSLGLRETLDEVARQAIRVAPGTRTGECISYLTLADKGKLRVISANSPEVFETFVRRIGQRDLADLRAVDLCGGIVDRVARSLKTRNVPDVERDRDFVRVLPGTRAQLSVPLKSRGELVGVLTLEHETPGVFSKEDERNLESLAVQATAAIRNAQRHDEIRRHKEELEALHRAAHAMSVPMALPELRERIVQIARKMFNAGSAVLWPYDDGTDQFLIEGLATAGIPLAEKTQAKQIEPARDHSRYTALRDGWIGASDLADSSCPYLTDQARGFFERNGIRSFQAIALRAGDEPIGVLFVNYAKPRSFDENEREQLQNFASYAALTLKAVRLYQQASRENVIGNVIPKVSNLMGGLDNPEDVLLAAATLASSFTGCDLLRLYIREPDSLQFDIYEVRKTYPEGERPLLRTPVTSLEDNAILREISTRGLTLIRDRGNQPKVDVAWPGVDRRKLKAWIAITSSVGVLLVGYERPQHFAEHELSSTALLFHQASVALANIFLYSRARKREDALNALYHAGRAIARSLRVKDTLKAIAAQALEIVGPHAATEGSFTYVALLEGSVFKIEVANPVSRKPALSEKIALIDLDRPESQVGVVGRAVRKKATMNVPDVLADPDYIPLFPEIRAQLAVPLMGDEDSALGVISIESPEMNAFSREDERNIELLAAQASVAIQNANRYSELQEVKGLVGTRTALVWINLMAAAWRHDIEVNAITIRYEADIIRDELARGASTESIVEGLERIWELADQISKRPITPPLEADAGRSSLSINAIVADWTQRLWNREQYKGVRKTLSLRADERARVHASAEWLWRAFDYIVSNAVKAVQGRPRKHIEIKTQTDRGKALISIKDNGPGIPPEIRHFILNKPVPKSDGEKGLGVGLLLAQVIAQAYHGDVELAHTGPQGTEFVISLPIEPQRSNEETFHA